MHTFMRILAAGAALISVGAGAASPSPRECPPLGPALPAPRHPSENPLVQGTVAALLEAFEASLGFNHSAVSVGIRSIYQDDDGPALLDFHHTPSDPGAKRGAKVVTGKTLYRVGSVTKVFTVLAALQLAEEGKLRMDDPVGKWVPGLEGTAGSEEEDELDVVRWEDVTLDGLATHLSGIGADVFMDLAAFGKPEDWEALGLPKIPNDVKRPDCSGLGDTKPCTADDLIGAFKDRRPPVFPSYSSPVYSNAGISLLGLAVEAAAGKPIEDVFREAIYKPAGMKSTSLATPGESEDLIIPTNGTAHDIDIGVISSAGSMNSNTEDLLAFATAILKKKLLSAKRTRQWLRPATFTSSWSATVGAPFEMYRVDGVTPDRRIVDVFTKGGDIIDYHSIVALLPEFGVAVTVLAAGPETDSTFPSLLLSQTLQTLIPALDQAARSETKTRFVGEYVDEATGSRLVVGQDRGPGLVLTDWVMRGVEVLPNLDRYAIPQPNSPDAKPRFSSARLYPSGLETGRRAAWRAALPIMTDAQARLIDGMAAWKDAHCVGWLGQDRKTYNYVSMDHFEFVFGEDGEEATAIRARGFDVELTRVSRENLVVEGEEAPRDASEDKSEEAFGDVSEEQSDGKQERLKMVVEEL